MIQGEKEELFSLIGLATDQTETNLLLCEKKLKNCGQVRSLPSMQQIIPSTLWEEGISSLEATREQPVHQRSTLFNTNIALSSLLQDQSCGTMRCAQGSTEYSEGVLCALKTHACNCSLLG